MQTLLLPLLDRCE